MANIAHAQTPVNCVANPTTALGAALINAVPNSVLAIKGMCQQQATIASALSWGITLANETGDPASPLMANDGLIGQIVVDGPLSITIAGISLAGTATDTGLAATLLLQRGAAATIANAQIVNGQRIGLALQDSATARIRNSVISGNGIAGIDGANDGVRAWGGSHLQLGGMDDDGTIEPADAVTIAGNGGHGIYVGANSRLTMSGGGIAANRQAQILAEGSASVALFGTAVTQSTTPTEPGASAIQGFGTTTILLAGGTSVTAGNVAGGVQVTNTSGLVLIGATVSSASTGFVTLTASGGSTIILSGGNTIANSAANGYVVAVDHNSALMQTLTGGLAAGMAPAPWSMTPTADAVTGGGTGAVQSSMELGVGPIAGQPSLTWTGTIEMSQHSTFRMSGGATLDGGLVLVQGSDGFFNNAHGSGNVVTGGVRCLGAAAVAHVFAIANSVLIAPGSTTSAVTVGTVPPACPAF